MARRRRKTQPCPLTWSQRGPKSLISSDKRFVIAAQGQGLEPGARRVILTDLTSYSTWEGITMAAAKNRACQLLLKPGGSRGRRPPRRR